MANLSWAKDAVMIRAVMELAYEAGKHPLKMPSKQGVSRAEIVTHAFECSVGSKGMWTAPRFDRTGSVAR